MALAIALAACGGGGGKERITVRVRALTVDAEVARSAAERAQGLSGRDALPRDEGMLFVFEQERLESFWMRDMRFPLDFVWIAADGTVVDLTEEVPPPEAATADSALPLYRPGASVQYVLEVNAGVVREAGLQVGDAVTFDPEP